MTANQWLKTPKGYIAMVMVAFLAIASIGAMDTKGIISGAIAVGTGVALDVVCCLFERRKRIMPDGAVISGLIIALILGTTSSPAVVAATAGIAILSKHLLVHRKKPVFNPAAIGLLLSVLLFHSEQSWWGAFGDLPAWTLPLLLIGGYPAANRVHKFPQVFSFLGTYMIILYGMGMLHITGAADAFRPPFINATLFFAFFMLTDPPTTPAKVKHQVAFGILAAVVGAGIYGLFGGLMYLFIGLLAGNLYNLAKSRSALKAAEQQRQTDGAKVSVRSR